jgi:hypothetical protein
MIVGMDDDVDGSLAVEDDDLPVPSGGSEVPQP